VGPEPFGTGPATAPETEPVAEPGTPPTRATPPRVVILSDSQAIDRRGRLINITGLVAVRMIGRTRSWILPLDSVEGGNEAVLLDLGGDGCDTNGEGGGDGGDGPHGGGGEQMFAGMQILMFEGDTIDCCEGEYEVVVEGECQCPEHLIDDPGVGCKCANLQDPEDYCHDEPWEYRFEIDAPCISCVQTFYESHLDAWACPIDCDVPEPPPGGGGGGNPPDTVVTLACDTVVRGEPGGCELTVQPEELQLSIQEWRFESEFVNPPPNVSGVNPWRGPLVASGQVVVLFTLNGEPDEAQGNIVVLPRSWGWLQALDTAQAGLGQFDQCFVNPIWSGLTLGTDCASLGPSVLFTPAQVLDGSHRVPVDSGPNATAWYVNSVSTVMHLRTQLARRYRTDGARHLVLGDSTVVAACASAFGTPIPIQNDHSVNTQCIPTPGFTNFVLDVWEHESEHMLAGLVAAKDPENDLYQALEGLAFAGDFSPRTAEEELEWVLEEEQMNIHHEIRQAALDTHTGDPNTFYFWRYVAAENAWKWQQVTIVH